MKVLEWVKLLFAKKEKKEKSRYRSHAEQEFVAMGYDLNDKEEGPNKWIMENIFELLEVFDKQGHSGMSAPYCANLFKKLALFEPCAPLSGNDEEWSEYSDGRFQNKRCSHVFKDKERFGGQAYDSNGRVFRDPDGSCWTNYDSAVPIEFPYTPKTEYVDRTP